jgi:tetratricopeptide (TPR) repeat protein
LNSITSRLGLAEQLLEQRRYRELQSVCTDLIRADPAGGRAYYLLGVAAEENGAADQAVDLFARAASLTPDRADHQVRYAKALLDQNRLDQARAAADRAAALEPTDALTVDALGVLYSRTGAYDRAVDWFRLAHRQAPDNPHHLYNLGWGEQYLGRFEEAERAYRRILELDPDHDRAYLALVELSKQTSERNFVPALERLFAAAAGDPQRALHIGHALAKSHEDMGDYERALDWLERAKAGWRRKIAYSSAEQDALFAAAASTCRGPQDFQGRGHPSSEPIFVVGMPRTGTTLVERILTSHPDVVSAGELRNFPLLVKRLSRSSTPKLADADTLTRARDIDVPRLGREYIASTRPLTGRSARFVDKLPFNFLYAGLIARALPDARIVCLRRDPMDSCLSNLRQLFATTSPFHDYAYGLEDTARYYVQFDRLMAHWRAVLPPERFLEIRYEDVVADQEGETRRLLAFCGLGWDERVLAFHENAAGVATASVAQVRQPIYATSVGRWRRYGERLSGLEAILREAGVV